MSNFDNQRALHELNNLLECEPPAREPTTIREFVQLHVADINALVARGWPATVALQRLAGAAGADVNERTLLSYLRAATPAPQKKRGRPSKKEVHQ